SPPAFWPARWRPMSPAPTFAWTAASAGRRFEGPEAETRASTRWAPRVPRRVRRPASDASVGFGQPDRRRRRRVARSSGDIALDDDAFEVSRLVVVEDGVVLGGAVVPHGDGMRPPLEAQLVFGSLELVEQVAEQNLALL